MVGGREALFFFSRHLLNGGHCFSIPNWNSPNSSKAGLFKFPAHEVDDARYRDWLVDWLFKLKPLRSVHLQIKLLKSNFDPSRPET